MTTMYPGSYTYPPAPQPPRRRRSGRLVAIALVGGLVGGSAGVGIDQLVTGGSSSTTTSSAAAQLVSDRSGNSSTIAAIAAAVSPSVVEVKETTASGSGIGSGVVLTSDGEILTNNHVVSGAANGNGRITVTFSTGKKATATIVGRDANSDLAVIKASGVSGLTAAKLGDSSAVKIGDEVVAIGSPEGLEGTVTSGIVSYLNRKVTVSGDSGGSGNDPYGSDPYDQTASSASTVTYNAIQTDASINPGNSGGPLINASGQVIGINSAIYSPTSGDSSSAGSVGLGFAIPINQAKAIIADLEKGGSA